MSESIKRGEMPKGTNAVLDRRNVHNANSNLLSIVKAGDRVLDIGCGSGSITAGIGALVGETGQVTGIDISDHLINLATQNFAHLNNVEFEIADIHTYQPSGKFNVITTARVLQWVDDPALIVSKMVPLLEKDGCIAILDYNHEKIQWAPRVPQSMQQFYYAFLKWRADAGMDNEIADNLETILQEQGFTSITVSDLSERTVKHTPEFADDLDIWAKVAETRGVQLVQDGYITEELRLSAISDYRAWIQNDAEAMTLYLLALTGRR